MRIGRHILTIASAGNDGFGGRNEESVFQQLHQNMWNLSWASLTSTPGSNETTRVVHADTIFEGYNLLGMYLDISSFE